MKAADRAGPGSGLNPNISAEGTARQASRMKMFTEAVSGAVIVNNWSRVNFSTLHKNLNFNSILLKLSDKKG